MGHRLDEYYYFTLTEAEAARDRATATMPYEETYSRGINSVKLRDPATGDLVDGYQLSLETYYG